MKKRMRLGAIGVVMAGSVGMPALAQQAARDSVIIVATRREEAPEDQPLSVKVLSPEDIRRFDGFDDAVSRLPGVQVAISNGSQATFQIRGIGAVDHQALTPSAAAVQVDGVFLATNVQASGMAYDLDHIEILQGPQGAIQGRNAASGSVNIFTARPTTTPTSYASLSYGRFDRTDIEAAVSGPVMDGIYGRIAGRILKEDAPLENVGGPARAGGVTDDYGLRGALNFRAADDNQLTVRAHVEGQSGVNPAPRNSALAVGDHQISVGADGVQDTDNTFYGLSAEYKGALPGGWQLTSLTAVEGFGQNYGFDFDGLPQALANLSYDRNYLQFSQEVVAGKRWDGGGMLAGLVLSSDRFTQDYLIWCGQLNQQTLVGSCQYPGAPGRVGPSPASSAPAVSLLTYIEQKRRTAAAFASLDVSLDDRTTLTVGERFTLERIEGRGQGEHIFADGVRQLNNRSNVGPAIGANAIDEHRFTGSAALNRRIGDGSMIYVSAAQGYMSGGFNGEVANDVTNYRDAGLFRAETVTSYEAGIKSTLFTTVNLQASVFLEKVDAPQARIFVAFPLPGGGSITSNSLSNLDAATVKGIDLAFTWNAPGLFDLTGGLVLLDTKIHQASDAAGGVNAATFDGKPLPFASDVSGTLGVTRRWNVAGNASLILNAFAKYQGAYFLDAEGRQDRRQGAVTTLEASGRLLLGSGLEFELWGKNLTDEDYALSGYGFVGYNTFRSQPATWGVTVRVQR